MIDYQPPSNRWHPFYEQFGISLGDRKPNTQGWVNFSCILPTHRDTDRGTHGSVNLWSGNYRCWDEDCRSAYVKQLSKPTTSLILTPREFLILTQGFSPETARATTESYRQSSIFGESAQFAHQDETFTRVYAPLPDEITSLVQQAQERLHPDLDIIREYMASRMLEFETLKGAGAGYIPEAEGQEECIVLPYYLGGKIVGVRGRTIDGRKGGIKNSYYCLYNLDSIDTAGVRTVIIVEGETDTLYLQQELRRQGIGIPVVGTPGVHFKREWKRHLQQFTRIIAVPQADEAAQTFITDLRTTFTTKLEIGSIPWKPKQHGKDIVDFCSTGDIGDIIKIMGLGTDDYTPLPRLIEPAHLLEIAKEEVPWVVPNLIERGTKSLIVGEPKTFKTWIALQLMLSVTNCTPFLGYEDWSPIVQGKVLLVEEEGSLHRLGQRVSSIFSGFDPSRFWVVHRQGVRLDDDDSFAQLKMDCLMVRPDLIILDPYASLHLQDENTVQGTMRVLGPVNELLRALPSCAVVIVHHTPKGGKGARGSGALLGSVDMQIEVERLENGNVKLNIVGRDFVDDSGGKLEFAFDGATGHHRPADPGVVITDEGRKRLISLEDKMREVLSQFQRAPDRGYTISELRDALNVSEYTVRTAIRGLIDSGKLRQGGGGGRKGGVLYYQKQGQEEGN